MRRRPVKKLVRCRPWLAVFASVLWALLLLLPANLQAGQTGGNVSRPASITVVLDDNYPPYIFRSDEGRIQGILVDQWKAWEKATGVRVNLVAMDWESAQKYMQAGRADVIDTIFYSDARAKIYDFTKPYASLDVPVFFHKSLGGISDAQSLRGFTVGVKAGDAVIDVLGRYGIHSLKQYESYKDIINAARAGDIRVFSIDGPPALYYLYKYDLESEFRQAFVLYSGAFHRAVKKGDAGLLRLVEQGFASIPLGVRQDIDEKWLGTPITNRQHLRLALYCAGGVVVLVLALGVFNIILRRRVRLKTAELQDTLGRLRTSEERFRTIFNSVSDLIFIHSWPDGRIVDVNQRTCDVFGYTREEMQTLPVEATSAGGAPFDQAHAMDLMRKAYEGAPQMVEWRAKRRDGSLFWLEVSIRRALVLGREQILVSCRDISDRKKAEEALKTSENTLRSLFASMTDIILILDADGRYLEVAPTNTDRLYRPPPELLGRTVTEIFAPDKAAYFLGVIRQCLSAGITVSTDYNLVIGNREYWFAGNVSPLSADRVLWVARDITERKKAEEALYDSRERLQLALDAANDGLWDWRLDTGEAYFSPRYYTMLGYAPGEFPANYESFSRLLHPDDLAVINQAVTTSLHDSETNAFEIRMRAKSGEWKWILTRSRVVDRDATGAHTRLAGTHTDITERKSLELRLADQLTFQEALLDTIPYPVFYKGADTRFIGFNKAYEEVFGVRREDLIGKRVLDLEYLPAEDRLAYQAEDEATIASVGRVFKEMPIPFADGVLHQTIYSVTGFRLADGTSGGLIGVIVDITERKTAEETLNENVAFLNCLDRLDQAIRKASDLDQMMRDALDVILDVLDLDRTWLLYPLDLSAPVWRVPMERTRPGYPGALAQGTDMPMTVEVQEAIRPLLGTANPLSYGPGGDLPMPEETNRPFAVKSQLLLAIHPKFDRPWVLGAHQCGRVRHWTERDKALFMALGGRIQDALNSLLFLRDLRESEERYRVLYQNTPAMLHSMNREGRVAYVSDTWCEKLGYTREEVLGRSILDFLTKDSIVTALELSWPRFYATGFVEDIPYRFVTKDGQILDILLSAKAERDADGAIARSLAVLTDVTEKKRAEESLRESEERYRSVIQNMLDIYYRTDAEGLLVMLSPSVLKLLGYDSMDEILGRPTEDFYAVPAERQLYLERLRAEGVLNDYEVTLLRKDGSQILVATTSTFYRDKAGNILGVEGIFRDISERKRVEEALTQARDAADAANRAKSEFLANMSHEIRTPLNGIVGMIQLLVDSPLDQEQKRYAQAAFQSSQRLTSLLGDILDLSRIGARKLVLERKSFVLADILDAVETLYRLPARQKGIELTLRLDADLPRWLLGDEHRLRQVLFNLVGNAVKFTQAGSILVEVERLGPPSPEQCRVLFTVADTGVGIPPELLVQSFEIFTQVEGSLNRSHQGAGLGLAIVRHLVALLGGPAVDVSSEVGVGTTFSFVLPFGLPTRQALEAISQAEARHGGQSEAQPGGQAGTPSLAGLRVLLVEDEEINLLALRTGLERQGLQVTCADSGEDALALLRAGLYQCILLDIQMPGMSGVEVARAIRTQPEFRHCADIPIIALTAFAMFGDRERFLAAGMDDYLPKPFTFGDLTRMLARILGRETGPAKDAGQGQDA